MGKVGAALDPTLTPPTMVRYGELRGIGAPHVELHFPDKILPLGRFGRRRACALLYPWVDTYPKPMRNLCAVLDLV